MARSPPPPPKWVGHLTGSAAATVQGVILGTAAYMAPEQAKGKTADRRSDIWAFGAILWEMLTGRRLFAAETVTETLAGVLRAEIPLDELPPGTPGAIRRLLRRCLERDPKNRLHDIADARIVLDEVASGLPEEGIPPAPGRRAVTRIPWILAACASIAAIVLAFLAVQSRSTDPAAAAPRIVASILPPADADFSLDGHLAPALALSPDGRQLAFVAVDEEGTQSIWLRTIDRSQPRRLPGTEDGESPFWSPDGRQLGFHAHGRLQRIALQGELVETIAEQHRSAQGASWSEGRIVYSEDPRGALLTVAETGGQPKPVTEEPAEGDFYMVPWFLPDGEHFLFYSRRYASPEQLGQVRVGRLDGSPSRVLFDSYSAAQYAEPGFLVWWHEGNLRAQRFDLDRLELLADPFPLVPSVRFDPRSGIAVFGVSQTGALIYQQGERVAGNQLTWIDRAGNVVGTLGDPGSLYTPRLSPDGTRVALDISGDTNQGDIWVLDAQRGTGQRLTRWPEDESFPQWSPGGDEIAFFAAREGAVKVYRIAASGIGDPQLVAALPGQDLAPQDWSPDGMKMLLSNRSTSSILLLDLESGEIRPFLGTGSDETNATFSPDGRWVAYTTTETGRLEVYVTDFPFARSRHRISTSDGRWPAWSRDGRELFYVTLETEEIVSVPLAIDGDALAIGEPTPLFRVDAKAHNDRQYDTVDGERFLVNVNLHTGTRDPLTLVLGWHQGLRP